MNKNNQNIQNSVRNNKNGGNTASRNGQPTTLADKNANKTQQPKIPKDPTQIHNPNAVVAQHRSLTTYTAHEIYNSYKNKFENKPVDVDTKEQGEFLKKTYGVKYNINKETSAHPHDFLASCRRTAERKFVTDMGLVRVADIGASKRHIQSRLKHVFSNRPIITIADKERALKFGQALAEVAAECVNDVTRNGYLNLTCKCIQGEQFCEHITQFNPHALLGIDLDYYDNIRQLAINFVHQPEIDDTVKTAYFASHIFEPEVPAASIEVCGTNTARWIREGEQIQMQVDGNSHIYEHQTIQHNDLLYKYDHIVVENPNIVPTQYYAITVLNRAIFNHSQYISYRLDSATEQDFNRNAAQRLAIDKFAKMQQQKQELLMELAKPAEQISNEGLHSHICIKCKKTYEHKHPHKYVNHAQFEFQCPNTECEWYYLKSPNQLTHSNPTNSILITADNKKPLIVEPLIIKPDKRYVTTDTAIREFDPYAFERGTIIQLTDNDGKYVHHYKVIKGMINVAIVHVNGEEHDRWDEEFHEMVELSVYNKTIIELIALKEHTFENYLSLIAKKLQSNIKTDINAIIPLMSAGVTTTKKMMLSTAVLTASQDVKDLNALRRGEYEIDESSTFGLVFRNRVIPIMFWIMLIYNAYCCRSVIVNNYYYVTISPYVFFFFYIIYAIISGMFYGFLISNLHYVCFVLVIILIWWRTWFGRKIYHTLITIKAWPILILKFMAIVRAATPGEEVMIGNMTTPQFVYMLSAAMLITYGIKKTYKNVIRPILQKTLEKVRIINTSCISEDNYAEVVGNLDRDTKWMMNHSANLSMTEFMRMKCNDCKPGLAQLMPTIYGAPEPIIYHICEATNYCAIKRQATEVVYCDTQMLLAFDKWFYNELQSWDWLDDFAYSYNDWYNHLTTKQQKEIDRVDPLDLTISHDYEMFVKVEKQLYESNGKAPKNRCICVPQATEKFVMGPITYGLEKLFKNNCKGYCGGKNWQALEAIYDECDDRGLNTTIQLDGSGFDRTQHIQLKQIVDHQIYKRVADKVHHVDKSTFLKYATVKTRKIKVFKTEKNGKQQSKKYLGCIKQTGKVFSGSMDTTLMNTIRMALYNRFVIEYHYGINKSDYELLAKGDDCTVFLNSAKTNVEEVIKCYKKVFSEKKTGVHGLGQIAKYLKVGNIEDVDFCSTSTYKSREGYKIIRKMDRFLSLTPWSRKYLSLTPDEKKIYMHSLYLSNLKWMEGLPFFEEYNDLLKQDLTGLKARLVIGQTKKILDVEEYQYIDWNFYQDRDEKYAFRDRMSDKSQTKDDFTIAAFEKYGLQKQDLFALREAISSGEKVLQVLSFEHLFK